MRVSRLLHRKGLTLVELVVAMAIFVVVIAGISAALGTFLRLRSMYAQQMIVQQNFGVAVSRISQDMRVAVVIAPAGTAMGETLKIYVNPKTSTSVPVTYYLDGDSSTGYAVYRDDETNSHEAITENMHQLVKLYFASNGAKVIIMMVGETTYGGKPNWMSFTSLIYTRNTGYPPSP